MQRDHLRSDFNVTDLRLFWTMKIMYAFMYVGNTEKQGIVMVVYWSMYFLGEVNILCVYIHTIYLPLQENRHIYIYIYVWIYKSLTWCNSHQWTTHLRSHAAGFEVLGSWHGDTGAGESGRYHVYDTWVRRQSGCV